eukprot:CAMPEP_0115582218 /NCGR_PEP_ID=MMETSP0272-20121206/5548_1 /TAXON_ID=71861 /ORGANISM="Scrippsiella trochoidea, Strain CCMP3099" /LENGTH=1265 /DNA_ID=CAMNT_0003017201 /DNA_START=143 /DNA_END=3938 /DNA_ORIENTATION=+
MDSPIVAASSRTMVTLPSLQQGDPPSGCKSSGDVEDSLPGTRFDATGSPQDDVSDVSTPCAQDSSIDLEVASAVALTLPRCMPTVFSGDAAQSVSVLAGEAAPKLPALDGEVLPRLDHSGEAAPKAADLDLEEGLSLPTCIGISRRQMRHRTITSLMTVLSGSELSAETEPELQFLQLAFPSSLANQEGSPGRRSLMANVMLCLLALVVGCLSPLLLDLSRTARITMPGDKDQLDITRAFPYDPLELLIGLALFNTLLGVVVMAFMCDFKGLSEQLRSGDLHLSMLPASLARSLADVAGLLSVSSGGGPLYVAVSNTRLIMVALLSRLVRGRQQTKTQWAVLGLVTLAALKYGLGSALIGSHNVGAATWGTLWAVAQAVLSAFGNVLIESKFKELNLWHARTVEQFQSLMLFSSVMVVKRCVVEPLPVCGNFVGRCMDSRGWDFRTVVVLAMMIANGWLSLLLVKRISALVEIVCKTAILPTLYAGYCIFMPDFHFEPTLFVCVFVIGVGILFYGLDRHTRTNLTGPSESQHEDKGKEDVTDQQRLDVDVPGVALGCSAADDGCGGARLGSVPLSGDSEGRRVCSMGTASTSCTDLAASPTGSQMLNPGMMAQPSWLQTQLSPGPQLGGPYFQGAPASPLHQPGPAAQLPQPQVRRASSLTSAGALGAPYGLRDPQTPQQISGTRAAVARTPPRRAPPVAINGFHDAPPVIDADVSREAQNIFNRIIGTDSDMMSRRQLIKALMEDRTVAAFVLPGIDGRQLMDDDESYEAAHHLFSDMSRGRQRVRFKEFLAHFQHTKVKASNATELRMVFEKLDVNRDNHISRHELLSLSKRDRTVFDFLLKDCDASNIADDEQLSDAVDDVYRAIAGDAKYFDFADFVAYYRSIACVEGCGLHTPIDRRQKRVLIIGPGFGTQLNPAQTQVVMQAGYQVFWVHNVPNPEDVDFMMLPHVSRIREAIDQVRPDLIMSGSKGGAYGVALWQMGYWRGPTVMINAHPSCTELPADVPIVLCHGDQDPIYMHSREELEALIATGSPNMCFLYYSSTSGCLASGHTPRTGDAHNMASLINFETLPRLMESVLCPEGPEMHMMRTWLERLTPQRLEAERNLGYTPQKLRQFWVSPQSRHHPDNEQSFVYDVPVNSPEFRWVSTAFRSSSRDPSTYGTIEAHRLRVVRIQRIENTTQEDGGVQPYYNSVRCSFESMGIEFVPGVHTRWLFHGSSAIDSIVSNPIQGFQPLASGSQGEAVWGRGTYFARDAEYVAAGPFC